MNTTTTPRRALFQDIAALLATAAAVPAACQGEAFAAEADEPILSLHRALLRQTGVMRALDNESLLLPVGDTWAAEEYEARFNAAFDVQSALFDKIIITPARTPAGRRAKAGCLRVAFEQVVCKGINPTIATIDDDAEWHDRLAWSLARDVLAEGSV